MADKRCKNGHFIDESWDVCPYCPSEEGTVGDDKISVVQPNADKKEPPARPAPPPEPPPREEPRVVRRDPQKADDPLTTSIRPPDSSPPVERTVSVSKADKNAEVDPNARYVIGWLVALNGVARGEPYAVRLGRNVIGRDRKSDIYVNDDQASAHHADLVYRPDELRYILMDRNSTNGTYVNDSEIEPRRDLVHHDLVTIGRHKFLFVALCDETFGWDDRDTD